jgi:hypothetical protein
MNLAALKDWVELIALLLGWIVAAVIGWFRLVHKINGVGAKVNALEITVGSHETKLDAIESEQVIAASDRKQIFKEVGEFKSEVSNLAKTCRESDEKNNKLLTDIQVNIGRLDTKVDILLQERKS